MQSLAAYSFEANVADADDRLRAIDAAVDEWLTQKGVVDPRAADGDFKSKTGDGTGQFARRETRSSIGTAREVELIETASTGEMFTTAFQVALIRGTVSVFATLSATPGHSLVAPIKLYPRCPGIIRTLIERFDDWRFAGQEVPVGRPFDATNAAGVRALSRALRDKNRKLPLVVISMDEDEQVWPDLHEKAAEQLIGLADVAYVDAESSWLLTDELGTPNSCFLGAVRLYWPSQRSDGSYEGVTWIAARLAPFGQGDAGRNRFLATLRRTVMGTAALTMVQPSGLREIQSVATKERLNAMEVGARDRELDAIVAENASLSADLEAAKLTISSLQWKLAAASYAQRDGAQKDEGEEEPPFDDAASSSPAPGETRYYKKIGSGGGVDTLVVTGPCQHKPSHWKPAFKGDQAEKGLLKLEGRNDWQSIAHCSACTGGGRWRVHW